MTFRQQFDGVAQVGAQFPCLEFLGGLDRGAVGEHVHQGEFLVVAVAEQRVERQHHGTEEPVAQTVQLVT